jgi:hypothetical protein
VVVLAACTGADPLARLSTRSYPGTGAGRMEDRSDIDIDDLWSALTEPQRLARWIGHVEGALRLGGTADETADWQTRWGELSPSCREPPVEPPG